MRDVLTSPRADLPRRTSTRSPSSDAARGLAGLAVATALAVGVPVALATGVGWPLPRGVPTLSEISAALRDNYIGDDVLIKALALVCWVVWAQLVASLVVEALACIRGRRAGAVPLSAGMQRTAARLVATIALLGALATARGVPEVATQIVRPLLPGPQATLVEDAGGATPEAAPAVAPPAPTLPVYEVQRYDTLWDIAEHHLMDPFRWPEIFELNRWVAQADGATLTDPDRISIGWRLQLPADAVGIPVPAPPAAPAPPGDPVADPAAAPPDDGTAGNRGEPMILLDDGTGQLARFEQPAAVPGGTGAGPGAMVALPTEPAGTAPPELARPPSRGTPPPPGTHYAERLGDT